MKHNRWKEIEKCTALINKKPEVRIATSVADISVGQSVILFLVQRSVVEKVKIMNRFLSTRNTDDTLILIPIDTIIEVALHSDSDRETHRINIFVKDETLAAGMEDYASADIAKLRFDHIESILNT